MTETIEYRTIDKSAWLRGPWDNEPDKKQWQDAETGLPCLLVRNPAADVLCGYVGVPPGHPWHGADCDDGGPAELDAHGGINFAGGCGHDADPSIGICHVPGPGETDDIWWFGFDCGHAWDRSLMSRPELRGLHGTYRTVAYVEAQCASLARQLAEASA